MQNKFFKFTVFLFVFTSINREFNPLHIDLRLFLFPLILCVLLLSLTNANFDRLIHYQVVPPNLPEMWLSLYLIVALFSNIAWSWNGLPMVKQSYSNLVIVFLFNLAVVLLVLFNRSNFGLHFIQKCIIVSVIFLAVSQVAVYFGVPIDLFLSDGSVRVLQSGGEHFNLFGQHFRVSGFAEDPNYACFFAALGLITLFASNFKHVLSKTAVAGLLLFAISLSWSRTIVFGSVAILAVLVISRLFSIRLQLVGKALCIFMASVALLAPFAADIIELNYLQTILTRFELWDRARSLFLQSPLIGNGLSSFRSFNMVEVAGWYVHCHSTFWSALAESGLFGFTCLFGSLLCVFNSDGDVFSMSVAAVFCLFCLNFDATYLQATVLILAVIPATRCSRDRSSV